MMSSLAQPIINGGVLLYARQLSSSDFHSSAGFKWGLQREQDLRLFPRKARSQAIRVLANPNRQRQIEAINGAWAMIGITAGLVIEGHTGNSIPAQLAGYWDAFIGFFVR
ncbi:hypothetical protein DH2020_014140 [Rehmannia glutinosa]|uniref:High light inducible protein n=1 Tax=Rehmannia glutinosa TaxID=99300 RepID=A0ABR0WWB2_REHGL